MVLIAHVIIALTSIVYSTFLLIRPSARKFYASYALVGATLTSGTYLVISTHSPLLGSCEAGLIYLGVVFALLIVARYRLAAIKVRRK